MKCTASRKSVASLICEIQKILLVSLFFALIYCKSYAQTYTLSATAATLANTLVGPGITISSPTLTCAGASEGVFTGATAALGFDNGFFLTNGDGSSAFGYADAAMPDGELGRPGDPDLSALADTTTYDACVLEFDFIAAGSSINVNYVFGSYEYQSFTCSQYNDVFGFFISGGAYGSTPTNIALVPGTSIPVAVNSINCGPTGGYSSAYCTAMGAGSPFCSYYIDHSGLPGTVYGFGYWGGTTVLTANASIVPCTVYHLKIGIADAVDDKLDSGVFLKAGGFSTTGAEIHGALSVCSGATTALTDDISGGTWSSGATGIATVGSSSGVVTGVAVGTSVITYTMGTGCYTTAIVTVSLGPTSINGTKSVCIGSTTSLSDAVAGGTWSSSNGNATVGTSGIVTGVNAGTSKLSDGCLVTATVTVSQTPTAINGTLIFCAGTTSTLTDAVVGGTWSSSTTTVATVGSNTGLVTGVSGGTATISYTNGACPPVHSVVTVNASPGAISGLTYVCVGSSISLSDAVAGGSWSASNGNATVGSSGIVTGITPGTVTISYGFSNGCLVTKIVTVNPLPAAILGNKQICGTSGTTLLSDVGGGIWISGNPAIATVDMSIGLVTAITSSLPATVTISYSIGTGCVATAIVTINPNPSTIGGPTKVCVGSTISLTDGASGGTWASSSTAIATIGSGTGIVTGVTIGTTTITYTLPTGCYITDVITVNAVPAPITGNPIICGVSGTTVLTDATAGGTWSASSIFASVGSTGIVTGAGGGPGTATITYKLSSGCMATTTVSVTNPLGIGGPSAVCVGFMITLSDAATGGTWSSSNTGLATIGSSNGIVTGIAEGHPTITYTLTTGCTVIYGITVNRNPVPIGGNVPVCAGATIFLTDTSTTAVSWHSSNTSVATVAGGASAALFGVAAGTATITFTITNTCYITTIVTVNPIASVISGTKTVCVGSTTTLTEPISGTWSTSSSHASVGSSTGIVTGGSAGTATITFTPSDGCPSVQAIVTINPLPAAITGTLTACPGATTSLTDATSGGTWSSSNIIVATVGSNTGVVTGVVGGTATISYILTSSGCYATTTVTIYASPATITGILSVCVGLATTLSDSSSGGIWNSGTTAVATIGSVTGVVTGVAAGTSTVTYTLPGGCSPVMAIVTVNPLPGPINGASTVCAGSGMLLTDASAGGTWTSSNSAIANISSPSIGSIFGAGAGTATITYTLPTGCLTVKSVTVNPYPGTITGIMTVCVGSITTLTDAVTGGLWTSSDGTVGVIGSVSGIVTGIGIGTTTISYTLSTGCFAAAVVTVAPLVTAITGTMQVCPGVTTTLSNATGGGTWSSGSSSIASVGSSTGIVSGVTAGTVIISYFTSSTCFATAIITVNPLPAAISGTLSVCAGLTTNLSDASSGGTWSSSDGTVATIGSLTGIVTGIGTVTVTSTATITYTLPTGCIITAIVTVNPLPIPIIGDPFVCVGSQTTLKDYDEGGTWSSSNTGVGTVDMGIVTGITPGTTTITYTLPTGCIATVVVTVYALPAAISGSLSVCVGLMTTLSDVSGAGTWSSGNLDIATIGVTSGVVTGISVGVDTIVYTNNATTCSVIASVTVNPLPDAISGTLSVCVGLTTALTDTISGGTWTSGAPGIAAVGPTSGAVTGISAGTATITYTLSTGCLITVIITVNPLPAAILGADSVCVGGFITLSDATAGGTWSSATTRASVDGSGSVTGLVTGTATVTYTIGTGCYVTKTISVDSASIVTPILGFDTVCVAATTTLTDATGGGVWSSSNTAVVTIGSGSGIVTGISSGTATISYTVVNSCGVSIVTRTIISEGITLPPITGASGVCSGSITSLTDVLTGGTWSSSNTAIATIGSLTGVVTGVASGSVTITYAKTGVCGTLYTTTEIVVNEIPYITTNFIVACQTLATGGDGPGGPGTILPDTGCVLVCDSSIVRYYAHGVVGSMFTWSVVGGTVINNYVDSIDVLWPTLGTTASITLYDTFSHCIAETIACIKVIAKPHAHFFTGSTSYCLTDNILFTDFSTADSSSPIVSWIWNFGDGTGTSITSPSHTYTATGTYTVTLVVKNACNCSDTMREVLTISSDPGPKIECAAIVCDSASATYTTAASCGTYNWSVIGGTITSGSGTASIVVKWNDVDPGGFGYVSLATPGCTGVCSDTVTIKVPVILQTPVITGPHVICANEQYEYSLPLWAATQYMWGVVGHSSYVVGYHDDHSVVIAIDTPGTYTIHGWYQNRLKLCGASIDLTVTVVPPDTILGQKTICQGYTETYSVTGSVSGNWTLTSVLTGSVVGTAIGTTFTNTFTTSGAYLLSLTGSFCVNPITINVLGAPAAIDSVTGPDTICLGRLYSYKAWNDMPGTIYSWQAIGGTISPLSPGNTVSAVWTNSGTKQLIVSRVSTVPPYCVGPADTITIQREIINPTIAGDTIPCANSKRKYVCSYTRGDTYDWAIFPNSAGSVVFGNHAAMDSILWNNVSSVTSARIVVTVHKCDSAISDTFNVNIQPSPGVSISASPNPACPGIPVTFTASGGGSLYTWDFGDGSPAGSGNPATHPFPQNTSMGNITYTVKVTVAPDGSATCPLAGIGSTFIAILPGPVAYASTAHFLTLCEPGDTALITGTVTNNVTGLSFQWYNASGILTGATDTIYRAAAVGSYYFTDTASNGCWAVSDSVTFLPYCHGGAVDSAGDGYDSTGGCGVLTATSADTCTTITLHGMAGVTSPVWFASVMPIGGHAIIGGSGTWAGGSIIGSTVTAEYGVPGIYHFGYAATLPSGCRDSLHKVDTVGIVTNYRYKLHCAGGSTDSVQLVDYTSYLPWWHIDSIAWYNSSGTRLGAGTDLMIAEAISASYNITHIVYGTRPGRRFICEDTKSITLPGSPVAAFSVAPTSVCEGVPINFTPTSTAGIAAYNWNFGDSSNILLEYPERNYTWSGPILNPQPFNVILAVTDSIGCSATATQTVNIYRNALAGGYAGINAICSNAIPDTFAFIVTGGTGTSPYSYLWSNDSIGNTVYIYQSGSYWVTVTDAHQCQRSFFAAQNIKIIQPPTAQIFGLQNYCFGQAVNLSGYAGTGISYAWWRGATADGTSSYISDGGLPADAVYQYVLILGITDTPSGTTCYDTSTIDSIHVYSLPPSPTIASPITVLNCNTYHLELKASEAAPWVGTYNWSNGTTDSVNDIYSGGPYRVWFTDLYGCINSTDVYVPLSPDSYFPYFPSGCYALCEEALPITLFGPPDVTFSSWAWLRNNTDMESGTASVMATYTLDSGGSYQWSLDNGLCAKTSDTMDVSVSNCDSCQKYHLSVTLTCDSTNPASYILTGSLTTTPGATYTLGTDIGPIDPFSGTVTTGAVSFTLTFTTLYTSPLPDSVTIEVEITNLDGSKCFKKVPKALPPCSWADERNGHTTDTTNIKAANDMQISNAMFVFPNPASGEINISYDYGNDGSNGKNLTIYDGMGRKIEYTTPQDTHGTWQVNTSSWMAGMYIIRMEGNGKALQTQRVIISH